MKKSFSSQFVIKAAAAVSAITFVMCANSAEPIKITLAHWADAQAVVYTAKYVLETKLQ
ncbi:hypothetical protein AWB79_06564 [Caballeronia hypogeia]|uniref:ABC transporter substrate-binding protein n=1 Tax=Caballeronia hypogeia TaxID=1777140 RepID=A0A158D871_9BURK|nr:hypothetical protein AWB79_06564 [Caballeronia hypogeia]